MAEGDVTKGSPIPPFFGFSCRYRIELQPRHIATLKASRPATIQGMM